MGSFLCSVHFLQNIPSTDGTLNSDGVISKSGMLVLSTDEYVILSNLDVERKCLRYLAAIWWNCLELGTEMMTIPVYLVRIGTSWQFLWQPTSKWQYIGCHTHIHPRDMILMWSTYGDCCIHNLSLCKCEHINYWSSVCLAHQLVLLKYTIAFYSFCPLCASHYIWPVGIEMGLY